MRRFLFACLGLVLLSGCRSTDKPTEETAETVSFNEPHRPQIHFTPKEMWMNDPNGMVYYKGEYHLFYQHHPDGLTWGPMHWGHAVSKDMIHWEHLPIALYPDKNGLIFSGSAVVDAQNTSGLGSVENPPMVAIFTFHSVEKEKAGRTDYQSQGIAYSTDNGRTWKMFEGNPVLPNQGIKDFRDPKVFWHNETGKWVMILAVDDHVEMWGSPNLKDWSLLSEFGKEYGAHGGVWECPDLFPLPVKGESQEKWVMLVSLNPGGPNGGSATQYFIGGFDGKTFTPDHDKNTTTWLDYGPDNYAGVTWSGAPGNRKIFLGWMSNWAYAEAVPTSPWRSANTLPRDLSLVNTARGYRVTSSVSPELSAIAEQGRIVRNVEVKDNYPLNDDTRKDLSKSMISGIVEVKNFVLTFSNAKGQKLRVGYDAALNQYFVDRGNAGDLSFSERFVPKSVAPRLSDTEKISFTVVCDVSSVEVFFDDGLTVMTALFFPDEIMSFASLEVTEPLKVEQMEIKSLQSIW